MKVFVAGGAGYVGSHCVKALCDAGHKVLVFDNLSGGHTEAVDARATLVVGDLADDALVDKTFADSGVDAVMHFAAFLNVGESVDHPLSYYRNNVSASITLLESMRKHAIKNFVFSSSCAIYGVPPALPITEKMPHAPISPYGRTKLAVEWVLGDCVEAWGLRATALRYFNASGAAIDGTLGEDRDPEYHLVPVVLQVALGQRDQIKIFGDDYPTRDGTCVRDYVHVEDLAAAHRLAIEQQSTASAPSLHCYNVGTGSGVSVKELIDVAREVTGHEIPTSNAPRRPGDPPELYADPSLIRRELGWSPRYGDIKPIVESAWQWHRAHPQGY